MSRSAAESNDSSPSRSWKLGNRWVLAIAACLLTIGLAATFVRIVKKYQPPGPFDPSRQGLCDFHNGIYFPAKALLRGESPYGQAYADKYPVARQIPFFSPVILALHAPLAVLPLRAGEILNTLLQVTVLLAIAYLVAVTSGCGRRVDVWIAIAAVLIFTRGGHITVFNGYFTLQLILATFLAVAWAKDRPVLSGWMLMVVSAKPTYILPLGFLMLARETSRPWWSGLR